MKVMFTKEDVWKKVKIIPRGGFSTYKRIANELGSPNSSRAVAKCLIVHGCVMDENDNDVIVCDDVHCYKVINHDYSIGGYVFKGIKKDDKKRELLEKEGISFEKRRNKWFVKHKDRKKVVYSC